MITKSSRKSVPFKAQARTIDHLGKGQIADAPTAVSELWKNSYDAYARDVSLHLFDGDMKCGAIIDNGCGMTFEQLGDSWLTIGTASKSKKDLLPENDRFGLPDRFTQGEKGIGRLSTAFLAPVTLIVTKKTNTRFSAALIDWRLFENTYLGLHDIKVPMDEFDDLSELPALCASLQTDMLKNLALEPSINPDDLIIRRAWERFSADELEAFDLHHNKKSDEVFISTEDTIYDLCTNFKFNSDYSDSWCALLNKVEEKKLDGEAHGTALFLIDLNRDLKLLTNRGSMDRNADEFRSIKRDLVDTLRSFVDPFNRVEDDEKIELHYEIASFDEGGWLNGNRQEILNYSDVFGISEFEKLEHKIEGLIDDRGWFRGDITAFGERYSNVEIPCRSSGMGLTVKTGQFGIQIGSFELDVSKSRHLEEEHTFLKAQADKYSGLLIFRDGLRVLPYGRVDNDFFEIEERRAKNAGRYFWSSRKMFGQISLHQDENYLLRDKSGREGFIKNQAARELKSLVSNLLLAVADNFFGSKSDTRKVMLKSISKWKKQQKRAQKASADVNLDKFMDVLDDNEPLLIEQVKFTKILYEELETDIELSLHYLDSLVEKIDEIDKIRTELKTPNKPANIGASLESQYRGYRDLFAELSELLRSCRERFNKLEAQSQHFSPIESAHKKYKGCEAALTRMINRYSAAIEKNLSDVSEYWKDEARADRKTFEKQALSIVDKVTDSSDTVQVLNTIDAIYINLTDDISYRYEAFLQALDKLEQGIDLDSAFVIAEEERAKADKELNQIRSLAQLGMSFEVLSHELDNQDDAVTRALNSMTYEAKQQIGFKNALQAHKQLTSYLKFLTPLKLSGYQPRREITGSQIIKNIEVFFEKKFTQQNVNLFISDAFKRMVFVDVLSRIQPVFINILNNALYWVGLAESRVIKIDIIGDLVVIANSGPAVDQDDIERLFELFYSRRTNGNGVGLYLSKQNLAVAHHKIWYAEKPEDKLIKDGANFVIQFRGMEVK